MRRLTAFLLTIFTVAAAFATDALSTDFSYDKCMGSALPYPADIKAAELPDTLTPIFINHVGRHGARYAASSKGIDRLLSALRAADSLKTITPEGRKLRAIAEQVVKVTAGQWGALDSLGMAEQRGIASRMMRSYPALFKASPRVEAISSYAPRCIMSMYSFTHQMARLNNRLEINTSSGRQHSRLMRPFDVDPEYKSYREGDTWEPVIEKFRAATIPTEPLKRVLGDISHLSPEEARSLVIDEYQLLAGMAAIGLTPDIKPFFSLKEWNAAWSAFNLRQYLLYAANTVSTIPADMASPLLMDLIATTDSAAASGGNGMPAAMLRFGHAETLMPLISLLRLKGGYYMTNYFETVGSHWQDFNIVPMAANLQFVLLRSDKGRYYLRVDLNERPIPLMPGSAEIYLPWERARDYMNRCIPIFYQPY